MRWPSFITDDLRPPRWPRPEPQPPRSFWHPDFNESMAPRSPPRHDDGGTMRRSQEALDSMLLTITIAGGAS